MDDEMERMMVRVRADTSGFARDVAEMRAQLDGPLHEGADRAGRAIETTLARAVRTGKLGFEDLRKVALSAMAEIAASAVRGGIAAILGGGARGAGSGGGSLLAVLGGLVGGAPGRATGGPVSPGRPYWVGERGPELFVPTAAGQVAATPSASAARDVRVAITVSAPGGSAPGTLDRSARQVARAVKAALMEAE